MKPRTVLLAAALVAFSATVRGTESSSHATLVKAARLIDPRTGNVLSPAAVLIENGKIKAVGPPSRLHDFVPVRAHDLRDHPEAVPLKAVKAGVEKYAAPPLGKFEFATVLNASMLVLLPEPPRKAAGNSDP